MIMLYLTYPHENLLGGGDYYYPHFSDEDTRVRKGHINLRSYNS